MFVRLTADKWGTFTDYPANFQATSSKTADTFAFEFAIAPSGEDPDAMIEFCVCFEMGPFNSKLFAVYSYGLEGRKLLWKFSKFM